MNIRKIAAAAAFATGAALTFAPLAAADSTSDAAATADSLISGLSPAATTPINLDISFNGYDLYNGGGSAVAETGAQGNNLFNFAIAYGAGATAYAEGGTGNFAEADGTDALARAGSLTTGATGFSYNTAVDVGSNTAGGSGAPDGAYAGGGSLIGAVNGDSAGASSHNSAYDFGDNGPNSVTTGTGATAVTTVSGGNSGAFAGDGHLIGIDGAGSGDTAYVSGNIDGQNSGPAAVAGNNNYSSVSGSETGNNEGAFSGIGNNNSAIADTNYTTTGDGVSAIGGNSNYGYVFGPDNSTAEAGGTSSLIGETTQVGNNDISYVYDPFASLTSAASDAASGSTNAAAGSNDIAEVLLTHGDASAQGANLLYDFLTLFGNFTNVGI